GGPGRRAGPRRVRPGAGPRTRAAAAQGGAVHRAPSASVRREIAGPIAKCNYWLGTNALVPPARRDFAPGGPPFSLHKRWSRRQLKSETRNPKLETNPKSEKENPKPNCEIRTFSCFDFC